MHTKIREATSRLGVERVIYGSGSPFGHPAFEIPKVKISGLSDQPLSFILGKNAAQIFRLDTTLKS